MFLNFKKSRKSILLLYGILLGLPLQNLDPERGAHMQVKQVYAIQAHPISRPVFCSSSRKMTRSLSLLAIGSFDAHLMYVQDCGWARWFACRWESRALALGCTFSCRRWFLSRLSTWSKSRMMHAWAIPYWRVAANAHLMRWLWATCFLEGP